MELHKDARWYESWKSFTENNPYINKFWEMKTRYDESENPVIRTTRFFMDKISDVFGSMFSSTDLSQVLTEICKSDPTFSKEQFLLMCEKEIIPNILEAIVQCDLEVLKDWCHEVAYRQISEPLQRAKKLGYVCESRVLDISRVDIVMGKMLEQGPMLLISFHAQQIEAFSDSSGTIVEGDPSTPFRVNYIWAMCRDQQELNPRAAWRLLEFHMSTQKQWI